MSLGSTLAKRESVSFASGGNNSFMPDPSASATSDAVCSTEDVTSEIGPAIGS
jgi:hypothetical protein